MNCNFNHFKNKSEHSLSVNVVFEQNYTIFRIYDKITIIECVFLIIHRISHCTQKNNGIFYSSFQDDKALLVRKFELSVTKIYPNNLKMNYSPNLGFVPSFRALLQLLWGFFPSSRGDHMTPCRCLCHKFLPQFHQFRKGLAIHSI